MFPPINADLSQGSLTCSLNHIRGLLGQAGRADAYQGSDQNHSLALIGNATSYISNSSRNMIVDKICPSRPKLTSFLKEVCAEDVGHTEKGLSGPQSKRRSQKEQTQ